MTQVINRKINILMMSNRAKNLITEIKMITLQFLESPLSSPLMLIFTERDCRWYTEVFLVSTHTESNVKNVSLTENQNININTLNIPLKIGKICFMCTKICTESQKCLLKNQMLLYKSRSG